MCARDDRGQFVIAKTFWAHGDIHAVKAEAISLLDAIQWLRAIGFNAVSIEMDCKPVVDSVISNPVPQTELGDILLACKQRLLVFFFFFSNFGLSFISRQANHVVHSLRRVSYLFASHHTFDYIPPCIVVLLPLK